MVKQVIPESCAKTGFVYLKLQWTMTDSDMMMGDFGAQWFEVQFQTGKTGKEIQEPPVSWRMLRQKKKLDTTSQRPTSRFIRSLSCAVGWMSVGFSSSEEKGLKKENRPGDKHEMKGSTPS